MGSELLAAAFPLVLAVAWTVGFVVLWVAHLNGK